ncbi:MAG: PDR/VanB family oxidoreductase [Paracoccaceae bacterium]
MRSQTEWRDAVVLGREEIAKDVLRLDFAVPGALPAFDPGAHLMIRVMIDGKPAIRTYTSLPAAKGALSIAVKLHPQSRGGSAFVWGLEAGDPVRLTLPDNRFELSWRASEYLLIAGGIGITPIYGMARALQARAQPVRMLYGAQNRSAMPFVDELEGLLGEALETYSADDAQFIDFEAEFARLAADGEAYICGPLGMLNAAKAAWARAGRPVSRLRYEVFGDSGKFAEESFEVEVLNLGVTVEVPPDRTMLAALREAGVEMISDCERGECGLCAVGIIDTDAEIDHRDVFFSDEEKLESAHICACVSRFVGGKAIIDIGYRGEAKSR